MGITTRRRTRARLAPRLSAARSRFRSTACIADSRISSNHRQRDDGMAEADPDDVPHEPEAGGQEVHSDGGDDVRDDDRQQHERQHHLLRTHVAAHQRVGGKEAQHGGDRAGDERDHRARPERLPPAPVAEERGEPSQGKALRREPQIALTAEGEHAHDDDGRHQHEAGDPDVDRQESAPVHVAAPIIRRTSVTL